MLLKQIIRIDENRGSLELKNTDIFTNLTGKYQSLCSCNCVQCINNKSFLALYLLYSLLQVNTQFLLGYIIFRAFSMNILT